MVTTQLPVLCHLIWTHNVRTASLITNNVKKTGRGLVGKPVTVWQPLVLPDGYMPFPVIANGILLTEPAVPVRLLPVVRLIML